MDCAGYKESLTEAALDGLKPEREADLAAHLAGCAVCRAALEDERRVVAAIERGLTASVAGEPSQDFASRVLWRVEHERLPVRSGLRGWAPAAAAALAVLALGAVWLARRAPGLPGEAWPPQEAAAEQRPDIEQAATDPRAARGKHLPASVAGRVAARRRSSSGLAARQAAARAPEPEVLVPPSEGALVLAIYRASRRSPIETASPLALQAPLELAGLSIPPLEVALLDGDLK